ncbi:MAG: single-stranded DNA-binding protein [Desulfuromonadales bacterium]|nr:single-stranded DNA-binding protein [Desulfuromonadales bacterium]
MSVNKVILVGNLGKDPELRYTPSGAAVATFSLATSERFKDKSGQMQEKTEWHNIVCWRQLAEICGKYLHKGKQVYIEGRIQTRSYDDKEGNKRYMTEIVADQMQMLGRAGEEGGQQPREPRQGREAPAAAARQSTPAYEDFADPPFNPDDDIPF